ncbi:MAG TPA: 3-hydroxyacyl-CoA dehydrogenase NAD-binding domain-containing protein [Candidatus Limnocylindrales bacterium]|nr:3-hydroxyacyl-CoA dehydrogenase NAD-binding domain-containing protein [Candidatus Limnocylindrales bacterium]
MGQGAVRTIAVVGAGVMGRGIALVSALAGFATRVIETSAPAAHSARTELEKILARGKEKGDWDDAALATARRGLQWSPGLEGAAGADLVIEAVPEQIALKAEVYRGIAPHLSPRAVIATNTSSLSITELAATSDRPDRFVGMHFFNPVHRMRLVELIRGLETSDATLTIADEVSRAMGKETVVVRESPGFVTSRVNVLIGNEAFHMLESGVASARDIDKALKLGLNHPMGPFELVDLVGLDTRLSILEYLHRSLGERFRPNPLLIQYVKAGRLGRKVGRGIYDYPQ